MVRFYLPNSEDMVDPEYDFAEDRVSSSRSDRYVHDSYAHEFFTEPIFDGMLISKTVVPAALERRIRSVGGVHSFCRLNTSIPVMGDCGAFTYRDKEVPPFSVEESAEYYHALGFTYGVALDHLIFPSMPVAERERRLRITLENARAFLAISRAQQYGFYPVGIAQGWDPLSRRDAMKRLLDMGYQFVAIGGVARSTDKEIRATLEAIGPILSGGIECHVFGVARLSLVADFRRYGVTSCDSASPMRRAFLGTGEDNYWMPDGTRYAAIRIPEVKVGAAKKRGISSSEEVLEKSGTSIAVLQEMERKALEVLRSYSQGTASLDDTLEIVLAYDALHGDKRKHGEAYRRTLTDRPWEQCTCEICRSIGVEVIIFRGNNRNRRRGFHNAKVFYEQFRQTANQHIQMPLEAGNGVEIQLRQLEFDLH